MEYINVRGHDCGGCTTEWWQNKGKFLVHVSTADSCEHGASPNFVASEHNFGRYTGSLNPNHTCTSRDSATTNYWFGGRV